VDEPTALSDQRLRFRAANGFASFAPTRPGACPRGEFPDRFRGCWLRRSPPRPSMLAHRGPRGPYDRVRGILPGMPRAPLLILTPTFPSRPDPRGPTLPAGLPLLGFPKIAPPSSKAGESDAREHAFAFPSGRDSQPLPRAARVVLHHLDGLFLSDRAGLFRPAADPGVRRGFFPSRNGPPPGACSALRSLPPADSYGACRPALRHACRHRGSASRVRPSLAVPSLRTLPPHPSLRAP